MMTTATVLGLVALGVLAISAISKLVLYSMKGPLEDRIAARYEPDEILMKDLKANSFGLESRGVWQARGNGGLVLTASSLHFFQFLPQSDLRIPLDAISELTIVKSHLGKATIYDLLKVHFSTEGKNDSIAWYLTDPKAWIARIESLQGRQPTN